MDPRLRGNDGVYSNDIVDDLIALHDQMRATSR
jgi:hypothetical protein